jgi:thymidylate kinase
LGTSDVSPHEKRSPDSVSSREGSPSPLVSQLVEALREGGVVYCHWKSNTQIASAERGETDLDLLIAPEYTSEFTAALSKCGFVAAERDVDQHVPGMAHFFAYDSLSERFIHVHAHYQLVLGHDRSKNYRLPIEPAYLSSVSQLGLIPTPSPEFEYVVFVVRMILKYAVWDELLWQGLRGRRARFKNSEEGEFSQLSGAVDREVVADIVADHFGFIGWSLFVSAEQVVAGRTSLSKTLRVGRRMEKALQAHARNPSILNGLVRIWRRVTLFMRRRTGRGMGFRLASGGFIVAIMGGDGAGKSTAVDSVSDWLSAHFAIEKVHLGKPPWSWTTYFVRGSLKAVHLGVALFGRVGSPETSERANTFEDFRRMSWLLCTARDRYRTYRSARRSANKGAIVISDRYPHPALPAMDVAQIYRLAPDADRNRLVLRMIEVENRYYDRMTRPDVAIVLLLDPLEAARRKTDERFDYVVGRSTEIWQANWEGTGVHLVDASRSRKSVSSELKRIIWEHVT